MKCPYCDNEMQKGIMSGDGRSDVYFNPGDKPKRMIDKLGGSGKVTAVKYTLASFKIEAWFCKHCKKLIIDTDVSN